MKQQPTIATFSLCLLLTACQFEPGQDELDQLLPRVHEAQRTEVSNQKLLNQEATVPAMCYTKTEQTHNPCYVCHQSYPDAQNTRYNQLSDFGLQGGYIFSDIGTENHWQNLFTDRRQWNQQISDQQILDYINQDNYSDLSARLKAEKWQGFVPDLSNYHLAAKAFDTKGLALDNSYWVAFNYKPLPSTFWPTNGATDDVLIRLPQHFREDKGQFSESIYFLNLALLELSIKSLDSIDVFPTNETLINRDINNNGQLEERVTTLMPQGTYFGDAHSVKVLYQQYPKGTEFMHSVRYVGVDENQQIVVPKRLKELRYMKKFRELSKADIDNRYRRERKEKIEEELPTFVNHKDEGFENGYGWKISGFIEDYDGRLRPQSYEEKMFCMGCHSAIGTTIDHTFAFGRKVPGPKGFGYINLKGMKDAPSIAEPGGEILNYFKRVSGGNEFRSNEEMLSRWFTDEGELDVNAIMNADVYELITPTPQRALELNKAYTHIVRHQNYIFGRDTNIAPLKNVHTKVDETQPPLSIESRVMAWDLRLNWQ
ncbi:hypothetical protein [Pleionea litopenaei]|uniref:Lipoprotein n=1 Tax=Pleionea litopenaei TaxID=3070815 RepID=A0AA51RTU1_9GAMM|nr:hypothetical protein [Pleionea sp. HL-JVS1]WMS87373.1 hypothetical protein Q9312_00235 [Pleionea sp. HL-JVS1]